MKRTNLYGCLGAAAAAVMVLALQTQAGSATEQEIHMTARKFEYTPNEITVRKGVPVVLEFVSLDRKHGFTIPELKVRSDVKPGGKTIVRFTPDQTGRFNFHCDIFCGSGHEGMAGTLVVVD